MELSVLDILGPPKPDEAVASVPSVAPAPSAALDGDFTVEGILGAPSPEEEERSNFVRGIIAGGKGQNLSTYGQTLQLAGDITGLSWMNDVGRELSTKGEAALAEAESDVESVWDVRSPSDMGKWTTYQIGQGLGSMLPSLLTAGAGAAAGGAVGGPVGAAVGAGVGAYTGSLPQTTGELRKELLDKGVSVEIADKYAMAGGAAMALLDAPVPTRVARLVTGGLTKKALKDRIIKRAVDEGVRSMGREGVTEAGQEVISQGVVSSATGEPMATMENVADTIEAGLAGAVSGGAVGGVAGAVARPSPDVVQPTPAVPEEILQLPPPPGIDQNTIYQGAPASEPPALPAPEVPVQEAAPAAAAPAQVLPLPSAGTPEVAPEPVPEPAIAPDSPLAAIRSVLPENLRALPLPSAFASGSLPPNPPTRKMISDMKKVGVPEEWALLYSRDEAANVVEGIRTGAITLPTPAAPGWSFAGQGESAPRAGDLPAPAAGAGTGRTPIAARVGDDDVAITATGREVPVRYAVVDADGLVTSQTQDGRVNPDYPRELQPRDRSRLASSIQIDEIARKLDPRLLGRSPKASDGAPIVSPDGVVESGNARTLAIRRAYEMGSPGAEAYRKSLADQGFDVEGIERPVLVRMRAGEMPASERAAFTREANERDTLSMSGTERAMADAAAVDDSIFDLYRGGDLDAVKNRDLVRRFMQQTVGVTDAANMLDRDGNLSQDAVRRVQGAMLAKAYADPDLVSAVVEDADSNIRALGGAMTDAAPVWARMRAKASRGEIPASLDPTPHLLNAVRLVRQARLEGRNVNEYVAQRDIFSGETVDPMTEAYLGLMFHDPEFKRPVGRERMARALRFIADESSKASADPGLLGDIGPVRPAEIVRLAREREVGTQDVGGPDLIGSQAPAAGRPAARAGGQGTEPIGTGIPARSGGQASREGGGDRGRLSEAPRQDDILASVTPRFREARGDVEADVNEIVSRITGGRARVKFHDKIKVSAKAAARSGGEAGDAGGYAIPGEYLVGLAVGDKRFDPRNEAGHEAYHLIERNGFFTDQERKVIAREMGRLRAVAADELGAKADDARVKGMADSEVEAVAFARYRRMAEEGKPVPGLHATVRRAFERLRDLLAQVKNALAGRGFQSANDVFERVRTGEVAKRKPAKVAKPAKRADKAEVDYSMTMRGALGISGDTSGREWFEERAKPTIARVFLDARRGLQDRMIDLKMIQEALAASRGQKKLSEETDTYRAEELYHGITGDKLDLFRRNRVEPLVEEIAKAGIGLKQFEDFMYARHAVERNAQIAKINPDMPDGGSGISNKKAEELLKEAKASGKYNEMERLAGKVEKILTDALIIRFKAGLIDAQTYAAIKGTYRHYVPLKSNEERGSDFPNSGQGFDIRGQESKRATGRRSKAGDLLAQAFAQYEEAVIRAEKNKVGQTFLRMVQDNPDKSLWEVDKPDVLRRVNPRTGLVETYISPFHRLRDDVFAVKVNGEVRYITIHHERLAHAMKNLGQTNAGALVQALSRFNRYLAWINTSANPEFLFSNFVRDIQAASINLSAEDTKGMVKDVIRDVPKAMRGMWADLRGKPGGQWKEYAAEFGKAGGRTTFFGLDDIATRSKRIEAAIKDIDGGNIRAAKRAITGAFNLISDANSAVENAIRLSTYVHARKNGATQAQAASLAKNLTVNFNRRGEWATTANAMYLFYNASIQGSVRMVQALGSPRVQKIVGGIVVSSFFLDMINRMIGGEDEDGQNVYDKIPEYVKENNLILVAPGGSGRYLKMPLPYGYNVFHAAGQKIGAVMAGEEKPMQAAADLVKVALNAFNPIGGEATLIGTLSPTITDPLVEHALNQDFAGRPIVPEDKGFGVPRPDSQRYWSTVGKPFQWVSEQLNSMTGGNKVRPGAVDVSPETLEYIFDFFTGATGMFVERNSDLVISALRGEAPEVQNVPFVRRVLGTKPNYADTQAFYEILDRATLADKEVEILQETGRLAEAREARRKYRADLRILARAKSAQGKLASLRKRKDMIESNTRLSRETKKARLDSIERQMQTVVNRVAKQYERAGGDV